MMTGQHMTGLGKADRLLCWIAGCRKLLHFKMVSKLPIFMSSIAGSESGTGIAVKA